MLLGKYVTGLRIHRHLYSMRADLLADCCIYGEYVADVYTICYLFMQKNSFLIAYSFCSLTSDETYMMCPEYWLRLAPHANTYLYEIPTTRGERVFGSGCCRWRGRAFVAG